MKKKALAFLIASAMIAPPVLAAQDKDGMSYTSAAEGLSGNVEARYNSSGGNKDNEGDMHFRGDFSVKGDVELQPGLTGFYELGIRDNTAFDTKAQAGMKGSFGSVAFGDTVGGVESFIIDSTDIANGNGGDYDDDITGSDDYWVLYTSPDMNGFQFAIEGQFKNTTKGGSVEGKYNPPSGVDAGSLSTTPHDGRNSIVQFHAVVTATVLGSVSAVDVTTAANNLKDYNSESTRYATSNYTSVTEAVKDKNTLDFWGISAKYSISGFTASAGYTVENDGLSAIKESGHVYTSFGAAAAAAGGTTCADGQMVVDLNRSGGKAANERECFTISNVKTTSQGAKGIADRKSWVVGLAYSQDNWGVSGWYAERENQGAHTVTQYDLGADGSTGIPTGTTGANTADDTPGSVITNQHDSEYISLAGHVSVDKVRMYGIYNSKSNVDGKSGTDDSVTTLGVQYNLSARAKTWLEFVANDKDSVTTEEDWFQVGLRYNF